MGNYTAIAFSDSKDLIYQAEYEGEEDCEVPGELARLLQQEEKDIQPHEELLDTINLGTEEDKKEIKVGGNLEPSVKERLIQLLHDYFEIFETKDGKTFISISYDPSGYYRGPLSYVSKYSPFGKDWYEDVKDNFEEVNDNNNPDPDAEISPLKIDVKGYFKN